MACFLTDNIPKIEYLMLIKDTHTKKAPSNKTPVYTKIMNMDILVVST